MMKKRNIHASVAGHLAGQYTKIPGLLMAFFCSCLLMACQTESEAGAETEADTLRTAHTRQIAPKTQEAPARVRVGAERLLAEKLDMLSGNRVAVVANHTSCLPNGPHLVDTLLISGVEVVQVFSPEHGFRGTADAGEAVQDGIDQRTRLPIISLYGNNKKPKPSQLQGVDLILFDIQDVGSRHYTYLGTLSYVMEAAADLDIPVMVLDRPNPNGWYVGGPVLETQHQSFIGMHPVPIVHGMTVGEYAQMVNEEGWLEAGKKAALQVIECEGYAHDMSWEETQLPWIAPSPNLGTEYAAYLYPAICWFEPTPVSVGRGTDSAFTVVGAPWWWPYKSPTYNLHGLTLVNTTFTPRSLPGKSKYPKHQDVSCNGIDFQGRVPGDSLLLVGIELIQNFYTQHQKRGPEEPFFRKGFERWPGQNQFRKQIESGVSPEKILASWQPKVEAFRSLRSRYLRYP